MSLRLQSARSRHCSCPSPLVVCRLVFPFLLGLWGVPVRADVSVSTGTTGPLFGDGGTFTVTSSGSIASVADSNGIVAQTGNTITTLTVDGVIASGTAASGVRNFAGSTMSAINASGTIQGGWAIQNDGGIGSISNTGLIAGTREWAILGTTNSSVGEFTNAGTIESVKSGVGLWTTGTVSNLAGGLIRSTGNDALYLNGVTTLLTNAGTISSGSTAGHGIEVGQITGVSGTLTTAINSGLVEGGSAMVVRRLMQLGTLTNSGTFRGGDYGILIQDQAGTVSNLAGGLIEATGFAALSFEGVGASVGSLDNAGRILGRVVGIAAYDVSGFTSLTNSGTISGAGWAGIDMYATGTTATLSNSGVITAGGGDGIAAGSGTIMTLVNSGTVSGSRHGVFNDTQNTIGTLTNEAGGLINGNSAGLYVSSTTTAPMDVTNAGRITGSNAGVNIVNSRLLKLTNTGTLSFSGTGTGPAVRVGPGSVLGVASGTVGAALASTGAGALLAGTIENRGTIHYGFTVDNQDVTVSAGGAAGTFTSGTLKVTNGNLSFTSGTTTVAASVSANSGAGTVITATNATVRFIGLGNLTADIQSFVNSGVVEFQQAVTGSLARPIQGTGSVLKTGTGNLILSATSTYVGPTSVNAGRLTVNGALGDTAVTVQSGAELGGSGSIVGALAVLSGGTLAPGNSIESLAGGDTSFAAGSTFAYEVDSSRLSSLGTAADLLVVNGDLDITSGALITLTDITGGAVQPFVQNTTVFAMINYSGNWNGGLFTYNGTALADGSLFKVGSQWWEIDYNRTSPTGLDNFTSDYLPSSKFVAITAVPEPSTFALGAAGIACAAWLRHRRRVAVR